MRFTKLTAAVLFILSVFAIKSFSQDMQPPKPVENKSIDAMVGDWSGETTRMGMTFKTDLSIRWALNHQFIIVDISDVNKDNANMKYTGHGVYGIDEKGNLKSWWFDDWGINGMSSGSGTVSANKLQVASGNDFYSESRTFEANGSDGKMSSKGSYTMNGQKVPFEETGSFHKK